MHGNNMATTSNRIIDPVCGMTVAPERAAAHLVHDGRDFYFCSKGCAAKFQQDPDRFLAAPGSGPMVSEGARAGLVQLGGPVAIPALGVNYVCPMDPEVHGGKPGACPKCGMALEPDTIAAPTTRTEYTCPMHPEIVRPGPGSCPICGMALEPRTITLEAEENPELRDMTRRFWISLALTLPLLGIAMADMLPRMPVQHALPGRWLPWFELLLATPVVLWGGWPFFQRGWSSVVNRSTNMFTLIALGTGAAYAYSVAASLAAGIFPASFREMDGTADVYCCA